MAILTQKTVKLMGIVGVSILAIGGGALLGQPLFNSYNERSAELETIQAEVDRSQDSLNALLAAQSNFEAIDRINQQLVIQFPELALVPELLDTLTAGAVASGISPSNIPSITFGQPTISIPIIAPVAEPVEGEEAAAPITEVSTNEFAVMEVGITITGSEAELEQFLSFLNEMDRAFLVSSFSISSGEDGIKTLALTGKTFIYNTILTPEQIIAQNNAADANNESGVVVEPPVQP